MIIEPNPGETPLTRAIKNNEKNIVISLLESGANIESCDGRGCTPLQRALILDRTEIAQLILFKKYKILLSDSTELVKFLLDKPEVYYIESWEFSTLLYYASKINKDIFKLVLSVSPVKHFYGMHPFRQNSIINLLVLYGNKTILKLALEHGGSLNFAGDPAMAPLEPLFYAVTKRPKIISFLIKNGADLFSDEAFSTVCGKVYILQELGWEKNAREVKIFERCGIDVCRGKLANDENEFYHLCRYADGVRVFLIMLERGVDINHVNRRNYTPLRFALEDDLFERGDKYRPIEFLVSIIVRMDQNREFISENNMECLKDERVRVFREKCKDELCRLKKRKITNLVSYYDFLTGDLEKLTSLARNKSLMKQFRLEMSEEEFPIYHKHLRRNFERSVWRLREVEKRCLSSQLPELIVEKICGFLNDKELRLSKYYFMLFNNALTSKENVTNL